MARDHSDLVRERLMWADIRSANPIAAIRRTGTTDIYLDWPELYSFRSRHPGGLQFANADGSVRFVRGSIELPVYRALATINGGEPVSPDS